MRPARLWRRLLTLATKRRFSHDVRRELESHVAMETEHRVRRGLAPSEEEARRTTLRDFGGIDQTREAVFDVRGITFWATLWQDVRFGVRTLRASPAYAATAIVVLAIGLGANTALFSLADALLLRSLPVPDPSGLVLIQRTATNGKAIPMEAPSLEAIQGLTEIYTDAAITTALPSAVVTVDHEPEPARQVFLATSTFFATLGVTAHVGRLQTTDAAPIVVISDRYWRTRFLSAENVIGRRMDVNGETYLISGVAPPEFLGLSLDSSGDIWVVQPRFQGAATSAVARLRAGITREQAEGATAGPLNALDRTSPFAGQGPIATSVLPGGQGTSSLRERYRGPLLALMALVALMLLVTCANVANLLVVRNMGRAHELYVRTALGARRTRLVRQMLTEGVMVAALGAMAAWWFARQMVAQLLSTLPSAEAAARLELHLDLRILAFMAAATLLTTLGFTLLPAWRASRLDLSSALRTTPSQAMPRGTRRLGQWTVGVQITLSVVLLTGAAMFVETVRHVETMPLGFERRNLVEVELADRVLGLDAADVSRIHDALLGGITAIPGVEHAALSLPLFPSWALGIEKPVGEAGMRVSEDYFATMKIPLIRGRLLTADDLTREDPVVVVNDWYAQGWFPGEDALGKRGGFNNGLIVGIVGNATTTNVRWDDPAVYRPVRPTEARLAPSLIVRTSSSVDPTALFRPIEQVVRGVNPRLLIAVRTADDALNRSIARERMVAATSGFFGLAALALAGIGLFGVAASSVANRTRELGLRVALGASRWTVVGDALRGTALVFAAGLAAGAVATMLAVKQLDHLIADLLIGLRPTDWAMVVLAMTAMLGVATLAAVLPALRAARVDPLVAMRVD